MLKAERDHLENRVKTLTEKVKYLTTPVREKIDDFFFKTVFFDTIFSF